jgi:ribosomal protein S18 acetylase RimI-like enzyme
VPFRPADDSWPRELRLYEEVLADPDAFCLVARRDGDPVGYAMVKIDGAEHVWETGDTLAELETLVVTASQRGNGVGALLMDALEDELAARGIDDLIIGVDVPNDRAKEFYERRGYRVAFTWLHGRPATARRATGPRS